MAGTDISDLFQVVCLGAKRCGEFIEATREAALDENAARLRRQAQVALSTLSSYLLAEAAKHYMLGDDDLLKGLERFSSPDFLRTDDGDGTAAEHVLGRHELEIRASKPE
jgi:hypothetical protein